MNLEKVIFLLVSVLKPMPYDFVFCLEPSSFLSDPQHKSSWWGFIITPWCAEWDPRACSSAAWSCCSGEISQFCHAFSKNGFVFCLGKTSLIVSYWFWRFPDGGCLPGLPSLTFQCSVTNNLHVQPGTGERRKFSHCAGCWSSAVSWEGDCLLSFWKSPACPSLAAMKDLCFLSMLFLLVVLVSWTSKCTTFSGRLNFSLQNSPWWQNFEIQSQTCFLLFLFNTWNTRQLEFKRCLGL